MKTTKLNDDVLALMRERDELLSRINEVERQLSHKRELLIRHRRVETAAHDVFRRVERRASCEL